MFKISLNVMAIDNHPNFSIIVGHHKSDSINLVIRAYISTVTLPVLFDLSDEIIVSYDDDLPCLMFQETSYFILGFKILQAENKFKDVTECLI